MNSKMAYPWKGYTKPFRIFGNLYFVGTVPASTHIIDTGDGLIMIDPGYPQSLYLVIDNMYRLGLSPHDIKKIIITHGHYDHLGAARALVEMTGAKTYIGKEDADYANGKIDLTWAKELGAEYHEAFIPDVLISAGDVISLGNTRIVVKDAPGHTPGTKAFFFDVTDGEKTYRVGTHGGVGTNSMKKGFLERYGLPTSIREKFVPAIDALMEEKVEIFIGNHVGNNDTVGKGARITETENPFIDSTAWKTFLESRKKMYFDVLKEENQK